jgi:hypothetical protein
MSSSSKERSELAIGLIIYSICVLALCVAIRSEAVGAKQAESVLFLFPPLVLAGAFASMSAKAFTNPTARFLFVGRRVLDIALALLISIEYNRSQFWWPIALATILTVWFSFQCHGVYHRKPTIPWFL